MPPPMSKMTSRSVVPIGTSTRPVLTTLPVRAKVLVPGEPSVPMLRYQAAPLRMMPGTLAYVSTLLSTVGFAQRPWSTVRGGLTRGMPRLPSIELIRAVSSPQTKAPAPSRTSMSKSKPVPKISLPNRPISRACRMAICRRWTAMGYSART